MDQPMDVTKQVSENLNELRASLSERTQEVREAVNSYVTEKPLAAVGIAFGVGYLLSGALFSRASFRVAHLGARVALGGALKSLLAGVGPGMLFGALAPRDEHKSSPHPSKQH